MKQRLCMANIRQHRHRLSGIKNFQNIYGEAELETCIEKLKQESRHYAKRQITWFKRRQDAVHITFDDDRNAAVKTVIDKCEDF